MLIDGDVINEICTIWFSLIFFLPVTYFLESCLPCFNFQMVRETPNFIEVGFCFRDYRVCGVSLKQHDLDDLFWDMRLLLECNEKKEYDASDEW